MKISKEITIAAPLERVCLLLKETDRLFKLWESADKAKISRYEQIKITISENVSLDRFLSPLKWPISTSPLELSPLHTLLRLEAKGKGTFLKVIVSGWEIVDPESVRVEMPQLSLNWERRLWLMKHEIESPALEKDIPQNSEITHFR